MEESNFGFFDQLVYAIAKPQKYYMLSGLKKKKIIGYFICLMFLLTVVAVGIPFAGYISSMGGFSTFFTEKIPAFVLENSELEMDGVVEINQNGTQFIVDTSVEAFTEEDVDSAYQASILISKTNVLEQAGDMVQIFTFEELSQEFAALGINLYIDNQTLVGLVHYIYVFLVVFFLCSVVGITLSYMISGLLFAFCGQSFNLMTGIKLSFGKVYLIALYAQTAMSLLNYISNYISSGFVVMIIWMVGMMLTLRLVNIGILSHKPSKQQET